MQPSSYYKVSRLPDAKRDALTWLAGRLQWERTLRALRSTRETATPKAA
ncbi:MAG: hypothetical protein KatS3mg010_0826 [Acidimicrobiia bacterium]|jgi:hypothetical protein|nr:MAG: hypothetical protein KatS3mg010_0826 [Acidimicrobiia bacterium]